jgi:hypothetical protein
MPMPSVPRSITSAPDLFAQGEAISLMKVTLVARKGIRRIFDQSPRFRARSRSTGCLSRKLRGAVKRRHHFARACAVSTPDDNPVRLHEIVDRHAFAQEFRVRGDVEIRLPDWPRSKALATLHGWCRPARWIWSRSPHSPESARPISAATPSTKPRSARPSLGAAKAYRPR